MIHPEDVTPFLEKIRRHVEKGPEGGSLVSDYRVVKKDGNIMWVSDNIHFPTWKSSAEDPAVSLACMTLFALMALLHHPSRMDCSGGLP